MSDSSRISIAKEHRFIFLLSALTLLFIAAPIARELGPGTHPRLADVVVATAFATIVLAVVFAVSRSRLTELVALGLAIPAIGLKALHVWRESQWLAVVDHCVGILFLAYAIVVVLRFLFDSPRVTFGAICSVVAEQAQIKQRLPTNSTRTGLPLESAFRKPTLVMLVISDSPNIVNDAPSCAVHRFLSCVASDPLA